MALIAGAAFGQAPAVSPGGIVNHFSYALPGMPNAGIAQGAIFDIYGSNLGPATLMQAGGFPLPIKLAETTVQATVGGVTTDVFLFFVARGQIAGLLPSRTPVGTGTLTVTVNGVRSAAAPITVVARSIGILTLAQTGQGPAVMQLTAASGDVQLNSVDYSAQPGQVGVFYGTGLGAVTFDESRGAPVQNLTTPTTAYVDGKPAKIVFQGRVPGLAGLDQFNIEIPAGISACYATVWFQTGNILSNLTTISVANGAQCPDPLPPPKGPETGTLKAAAVRLGRSSIKLNLGGALGVIDLISDSGASAYSAIDLSKVPVSQQTSPLTQIGGCIVGPLTQQQNNQQVDNSISYLDAGTTVTVRGPNGIRQLTKQPTGFGSLLGSTPIPGVVPAPPPPYLVPGVYTVDNGAGGPDVGPFTASITLPDPAFAWRNADQSTVISRTEGFEVTWTGGDASSSVDITGVSTLPRSATQPVAAGGYFSCRVPASLGRWRIPPQILLFLPPSVLSSGGTPSGTMSVSQTMTTVEMKLPGFQFSDLSHSVSIVRSVDFR